MPIDTGVSSTIKRPGVFSRFLFSLAGRGLVPLPYRAALAGMMLATGTATAEVPLQIFDELDGDARFGAGSELALMIRKFFAQCRLQGTQPELWAVGITPNAGGTADVRTVTFGGTATAGGEVEIVISGRVISVGVSIGDTASVVSAAFEAQCDAQLSNLPVIASNAAPVTSLTAAHKGANGLDVIVTTQKTVTGITVVHATSAAGAGVVDITNSLDALLARDFEVVGVANRKAADVTDAKANTAVAWGARRYRHIIIPDPSTLSAANALALASNDYTVIVASYEATPALAGEISAVFAAVIAGNDRPNANHDGRVIDLPPCPEASVYSTTEIESALTSGVTPIVPTPEGDRSQIVRMVTTKTVTNSAPDFVTFDLAVSRTAAYIARQCEAQYLVGFQQELLTTDPNDSDSVLNRIRDMVVGIHLAAESLRIIRDVEEFIPQIATEEDAVVIGRVNVFDPFRVVSPLHQTAFLHHAYV